MAVQPYFYHELFYCDNVLFLCCYVLSVQILFYMQNEISAVLVK